MAGRGDWIASDLRSRLKLKLLILIAKRESSQCQWVKEKRKYNTNKWMSGCKKSFEIHLEAAKVSREGDKRCHKMHFLTSAFPRLNRSVGL